MLSGERPHLCGVCGKSFRHLRTFEIHERIHTSAPLTCPECNFVATSPSSLHNHVIRHHARDFKHACSLCDKRFLLPYELARHVRSLHPAEGTANCAGKEGEEEQEKKLLCTECPYSTHNPRHLIEHVRTHTGERPHTCELCGRAFVRKGTLNRHLRTHTGERPFACATCGRGFNMKSNLQAHERSHSGEKKHFCRVCGKGFTRTVNLHIHEKAHQQVLMSAMSSQDDGVPNSGV